MVSQAKRTEAGTYMTADGADTQASICWRDCAEMPPNWHNSPLLSYPFSPSRNIRRFGMFEHSTFFIPTPFSLKKSEIPR